MNFRNDTIKDPYIRPPAIKVALVMLGVLASSMVAKTLNAQPAPTTEAAAFPDGPGRDLFASTCSQCHAVEMAVAKRYNSDDWRDIINKMIDNGAQISEPDFALIHAYLAKNFGPSSPAAAAPAIPPAVKR